jgi:hypothetical protein
MTCLVEERVFATATRCFDEFQGEGPYRKMKSKERQRDVRQKPFAVGVLAMSEIVHRAAKLGSL